jgi:hypothetical protein
LAQIEATPEQAAKVKDEIQAILDKTAGKVAPELNGTRFDRIQRIIDTLKEPPIAPEAMPKPPTSSPAEPSGIDTAPTTPTAPPEAPTSPEAIADRMKQRAETLRHGINGVYDDLSDKDKTNAIAEDLEHAAGQGGITAAARTADNTLLQWNTAEDDRVCPVCGPLDGMQIEPGGEFAPGIQIPVIDTHPGCRCSIDLIARPANWKAAP